MTAEPSTRARAHLRWLRAALAAVLLTAIAPLTVALATGTGVASAAPACPCSLFPATDVPANIEANDPEAAELGVQFESTVAGSILGIRFYKGPDNTGVHIGSLWTAGGTLLAQATFTGETASGWQQVLFASPVTIAANTVYVAGYHTNTGYYSYDPGYFTSTTLSNPPLVAPSDASGTPNGVFAYSASPTFPTGTFNGNNYWVDVVLATAPTPTGLQISAPSSSLPKGESEQLTATESFSDGSTTNVTSQVAWGTSDGNASVSPSGLLTANAVGPVTVTATLGSLQASVTGTVLPAVLTGLALSAPSPSLPAGLFEQLRAVGTFSDGSSADVTSQVSWGTANAAVLAVGSTGIATGVAKGPGTATATLGGVSASLGVAVLAPAAWISVTPPLAVLHPGQSVSLAATAYLTDGTQTDVSDLVTWALKPGYGATISSSGVLTGQSFSFNLATATAGRLTGLAAVAVLPF